MNKINILAPELPESINHATVVNWYKKVGDIIKQDEILLDIETEKVILEVPATTDGILISILQPVGSIINNKEILGHIQKIEKKVNTVSIQKKIIHKINHINQNIGNITKKQYQNSPSIRRSLSKKEKKSIIYNDQKNIINNKTHSHENITRETRIPMSLIRKKISEKLLKTKNNTAMLTTFNEVNMQSIINIREKYCHVFKEKHNIKLGFMSFFVKAVTESLKHFPEINARIDENDIIYYKYFDINIAISTKKGLVTPVLKDADLMSMKKIEKKIKSLILKGNENKLKLSDLSGGNFTITNGGVFGSLLSTPMINFPQTAILGIHTIKNRAIVINNNIQIAPMMYIALSYDHRLIDGKEAIHFLNMIKNILEDFSRILLNI